MATYFLHLKTFGRAGGSSAVSAAAYRAGERLHDERTGRTFDHSERRDVLLKEIILPGQYRDQDLSWTRDRGSLWNKAEQAESRANARVAREYLVALPVELSPLQRNQLASGFSRELSDRYGFAVDLTVHEPRDFPGSDPRNFHAHLLATTREVRLEGLGAKTTLELNDGARRALGLKPAVHELLHVRGRWATVTNEALEEAQVAARVDHRSLAAQGIDREPKLWIPHTAYEMERQGYRSIVAERIRGQHRDRTLTPLQSDQERSAPKDLEAIRRDARENWLRLRRGEEQAPAPSAAELDGARDPDLGR